MDNSLSLNGVWSLVWAEGSPLPYADYYSTENFKGRQALDAQVPASIHRVLMDAGLLEDPNYGLNSLKARWVEEMFWIYRKEFTVPTEALTQSCWLNFERLELEARIFLNGKEIGKHANANRPACFDVSGLLRSGKNLLVVQLNSGLHTGADKPGEGYQSGQIGLLTKRHWHRHPQCQSGWDWQPRLVNIGILGDVNLEWHVAPRLSEVTVFAIPSEDLFSAKFHVRVSLDNPAQVPTEGMLHAKILETGTKVDLKVSADSSTSRHEIQIPIDNPKLWWPIGHGDQSLYTVEIYYSANGETQKASRRTGVRRVEMDQSKHPIEGQYCVLKINNRPIFCKGGNWVPVDLLHSTATPERYRNLVKLAVQANFNLLRIWGGGLFADHALCEACDEAGILLWHDFLFACAQYPGTDPDFVREVHQEIRHAVRDLAYHPSIVVWCGNNEIEWGDWEWNYDNVSPSHPHYALFHRDIPRIVRAEDPSTLEWVSSPWSPDYMFPNDPTVGDQHPWKVSTGSPGGADWWLYRDFVDRFPNEGGVLGVSSPATLRESLPEKDLSLGSSSWFHHDNTFASIDDVLGDMGHAFKTVELWTGRDPFNPMMNWEDYAFVSALLQAEALQEYIYNYRHRMFSSASAVFWMFNDIWPVTHGWSIVDYYLRKKLAYYPVKRAFQPIIVTVTEEDEMVVIYGVNDTPNFWSGEIQYGLFTLDGKRPFEEQLPAQLEPNTSTVLAKFPKETWQKLDFSNSGAFAALSKDGILVSQHRLFLERFKDLRLTTMPDISMIRNHDTLTLTSSSFVWGVCLDVDGEIPLADNCFDLLPNISYTIDWEDSLGEPKIVRLGNKDAFFPKI